MVELTCKNCGATMSRKHNYGIVVASSIKVVTNPNGITCEHCGTSYEIGEVFGAEITNTGSGAIAIGNGAVAAGENGIAIGRKK